MHRLINTLNIETKIDIKKNKENNLTLKVRSINNNFFLSSIKIIITFILF